MVVFQTFLPCLFRAEEVCESLETYCYILDAKTESFKKHRKKFCRSDHTDDLVYIFGLPYLNEVGLDILFYLLESIYLKTIILKPEKGSFSDAGRSFSSRMMSLWGNFAKTGKMSWELFNLDERPVAILKPESQNKVNLSEENYWSRRFNFIKTKFSN